MRRLIVIISFTIITMSAMTVWACNCQRKVVDAPAQYDIKWGTCTGDLSEFGGSATQSWPCILSYKDFEAVYGCGGNAPGRNCNPTGGYAFLYKSGNGGCKFPLTQEEYDEGYLTGWCKDLQILYSKLETSATDSECQ